MRQKFISKNRFFLDGPAASERKVKRQLLRRSGRGTSRREASDDETMQNDFFCPELRRFRQSHASHQAQGGGVAFRKKVTASF